MTGTGLTRYDAMVLAIAECERVDEAKDIRDKAHALEVYARQAMNTEAERQAARVRVRAERKSGELLADIPKSKGAAGNPGGQGAPIVRSHSATAQTLEDLGISKRQSSEWQRLAAAPVDVFEKVLAVPTVPTTAGVLRDIEAADEKRANREIIATHDPDTCTVADLSVLAGREFGTVYADPPWLYGNQATRAATGNHYGGMTVAEICALPVADVVADNAHLHLWTTNAFLFDAQCVIEAWGFEYKSCFVWVKPQMGIGNYWRVSHEFMLLGVRGSLPFRNHSLMSWANLPRTRHSAKPETVRKQIESASPGPYLELFGRGVATGWTVWGNEIKRSMFDHEVEEISA